MLATGELIPIDPYLPAISPQPKPPGPKTQKFPPELDDAPNGSNADYEVALTNHSLVFSPQGLGFLPSNYWLDVDETFGELLSKFFQRKNNANCRFPHKLYNALALVEHDPEMFRFVGVQWVTDRVFKVDKLIFGRMLGISAIDGSLFHQQGNFPSHGFAEVMGEKLARLKAEHPLADVDQERVRLFFHKGNVFTRGTCEDVVMKCKWLKESERV
jgi:hypothetical protein